MRRQRWRPQSPGFRGEERSVVVACIECSSIEISTSARTYEPACAKICASAYLETEIHVESGGRNFRTG